MKYIVYGASILTIISVFSFAQNLYAQADNNLSAEVLSMSNSQLRREIRKSREQVYQSFNAVNDEDEYDINCIEGRSASSIIKERLCQPNFIAEANGKAARDFMNNQSSSLGPGIQYSSDGTSNGGYIAGDQTGIVDQNPAIHLSQAEINRKNKVLAEKMISLANENADLNNAITRLKWLAELYQARLAEE